jgi:hypothetical protein
MRRPLILSLFIGLLVACSTSPAAESEGGSVPAAASQPESAGGGGSDLVAAALAITDVCTVLPTDLVAKSPSAHTTRLTHSIRPKRSPDSAPRPISSARTPSTATSR